MEDEKEVEVGLSKDDDVHVPLNFVLVAFVLVAEMWEDFGEEPF